MNVCMKNKYTKTCIFFVFYVYSLCLVDGYIWLQRTWKNLPNNFLINIYFVDISVIDIMTFEMQHLQQRILLVILNDLHL